MRQQPPTPVSIVEAWQEAANAQNAEQLLRLSAKDIEIAGPRGAGIGHTLLKEWLARAGLQLATLRTFARGDVVVLEQRAVWHDLATGAVTGETMLASAFRVDDHGQVARVARYDHLSVALDAAGLTLADEVR